MKLISACLFGIRTAYDGSHHEMQGVQQFAEEEMLVPVCPEQLGGLPTPRTRARIIGGSGEDVLLGRAKVVTAADEDVTESYLRGARSALHIAERLGIESALLKALSPSCGCNYIRSEDFQEEVQGNGVTTALFQKNGIKVETERNMETNC